MGVSKQSIDKLSEKDLVIMIEKYKSTFKGFQDVVMFMPEHKDLSVQGITSESLVNSGMIYFSSLISYLEELLANKKAESSKKAAVLPDNK